MKSFFNLFPLSILFFFTTNAQTEGTFTFSFTPVSAAVGTGYSGTKNALAVWIEDASGNFIKTKIRNAGPGNGTSDHLPTWAVKSGGTAANCMSAACNITDAVTGATLLNYSAKTVIWDGKNVIGDSNGVIVNDGSYKVWIEETWNHGASGTVVTSFNFIKGPVADVQTPANQAKFTGISLNWTPSVLGLYNTANNSNVAIYPNPSSGTFAVTYQKAERISILDLNGKLIQDIGVNEINKDGMNIDLSSFTNGTYFISVFDGISYATYEVILTK